MGDDVGEGASLSDFPPVVAEEGGVAVVAEGLYSYKSQGKGLFTYI